MEDERKDEIHKDNKSLEKKDYDTTKWKAIAAFSSAVAVVLAALIAIIPQLIKSPNKTEIDATIAARVQDTLSTQTVGPQNKIPIESFPINIYGYKLEDPSIGKFWNSWDLSINNYEIEHYYFTYSIPEEGDGFSGLAFHFKKPDDISKFTYIETTLTFHSDEMDGNLIIKDYSDAQVWIPIGISKLNTYTDGTLVQRNEDQVILRIPLSNLQSSINLELIKEILFHFDSTNFKGSHNLTVHWLGFIKE
jgi:hypothetical protein